jgi:hypothetical protein
MKTGRANIAYPGNPALGNVIGTIAIGIIIITTDTDISTGGIGPVLGLPDGVQVFIPL